MERFFLIWGNFSAGLISREPAISEVYLQLCQAYMKDLFVMR